VLSFAELHNKENKMDTLDESLVREIEKFVFEAWDMGLAGADAIKLCLCDDAPALFSC